MILVVNRDRLPSLIQYQPTEPVQRNDYEFVNSHFYFSFREFSAHADMMEEFLGNPPDWLVEQGGELEQRSYLESRFLMQIYEKFEVSISDQPLGSFVPVTDQEDLLRPLLS